MACHEDGTTEVLGEPPGGTLECPSDKNREGCQCQTLGETAPCWPGLRVNRNRGNCRDGVTTCDEFPEFGGAWGSCEGAVLPDPWVNAGPAACRCFSEGTWEIDNLSPCFVTDFDGVTYAVSTVFDPATGRASCQEREPTAGVAPSLPTEPWSKNRLTVDCAGRYELCYTIKAGAVTAPKDEDCVVASTCVETWYEEAGETAELPDLPAWVGDDPSCSTLFQSIGGYGEMTVKGLSVECDPVDDGDGMPYAFNRRGYCPPRCGSMPELEECQNCAVGGSGDF